MLEGLGLKIAKAQRDMIDEALQAACEEFAINTLVRQAMFIAQIAHETGGFVWTQELGSSRYFAKYDGRKDLGNTEPGDGARYRGRGCIQLTGRANYARAAAWCGLDLLAHPEQCREYPLAMRIAGWFWATHGLNAIADADTIEAFRQVTRRINGGLNGWAHRLEYWQKLRQAWGM